MATQVPTAYRLELAPTATCTLRWVCTLTGFLTSGTRIGSVSRAVYETTTSTATRIIGPQPNPGDDLNLSSFQIEPLSGSVTFTLQMGEINPSDPNGASLSTKVLDVVTVPAGSCLQLDAGAGGWRIVTKTTSYPLA